MNDLPFWSYVVHKIFNYTDIYNKKMDIKSMNALP